MARQGRHTVFARATVGEPELLLADEPTAGLDPHHGLDAARRLRTLAAAGRAVVVAIHDLQLAAQRADDVVALRAGRVWAAGPLAEVFTAERLGALYDVRVRLVPDADGMLVRFLDRFRQA
jgi:iron complex transport system ATP-binding protein